MDEQEEQEETKEEEKEGMKCLDDETLEKLVKTVLRENNELTGVGYAAYKELKRRDPNYEI